MANRKKMTPAERAKQFMPFAALRGYEDALREKERIVVDKAELSEEMRLNLDYKLNQIHRNDMVQIIYYDEVQKEYLKIKGMVARLDLDAKIIKVVNTKIAFNDIYEITGEKILEY